jgi:hypothetical protein
VRTKVCELCGTPFECGADEGDCWCGGVVVEPERLRWLSTIARDCVCRRCLTGPQDRSTVEGGR